jgi:uncharacterized protein
LSLHNGVIRILVLLSLLLCCTSSEATDIQCESTQQPAQRVICDHAILNHEYGNIYEEQQKLVQEGKLAPNDLAAWKRKRDACIDVHCIDGVFSQWSAIKNGLASGTREPVITASEALGPSPASPALTEAAEPAQQSSAVPVARQGSAYGVALPQPTSLSTPASAPPGAASGTAGPVAMPSLNMVPIVLGVLLVIAVLGVGAMLIYQRTRRS